MELLRNTVTLSV